MGPASTNAIAPTVTLTSAAMATAMRTMARALPPAPRPTSIATRRTAAMSIRNRRAAGRLLEVAEPAPLLRHVAGVGVRDGPLLHHGRGAGGVAGAERRARADDLVQHAPRWPHRRRRIERRDDGGRQIDQERWLLE